MAYVDDMTVRTGRVIDGRFMTNKEFSCELVFPSGSVFLTFLASAQVHQMTNQYIIISGLPRFMLQLAPVSGSPILTILLSHGGVEHKKRCSGCVTLLKFAFT